MNKYLEKIADWREVEPGLHYNNSNGHYRLTAEKEQEINKHLDKAHVSMGAKVFGTLGSVTAGGLGLAVGERSVFGAPKNLRHRLARGGKGALIGGLAGAGFGALLAHGGNAQVHGSDGHIGRRLQSEVARRAHDYTRTTEYKLVHGNK